MRLNGRKPTKKTGCVSKSCGKLWPEFRFRNDLNFPGIHNPWTLGCFLSKAFVQALLIKHLILSTLKKMAVNRRFFFSFLG